MSAKIKIKKLEQEIEDLKKQVNYMIIDINDRKYAIYKKTEWDDKCNKIKNLMNDKKPVNNTAVNYEISKLYVKKENGIFGEKYKNMDMLEIPEFKFLSEIKIERNKQIYSKDPDYLIYKKFTFYQNIDDLFIPHNRPAREFEKKYSIHKH
ncbi:hypothetical protein [Methanobacterium oryzae]|uniref:hypothetical protein n=1 Tax=Methanobacterium oryzae TaxID=69540 RepID=UPI003D23CC47